MTHREEPDIWGGFLDLCKIVAPSRPEISWNSVDWDVVIPLAAAHKIDAAVWRSIDGIAGVPNAIKAYFHVLRDDNAKRNAAMLDGLAEILFRLNATGIKGLPLKGAANIADGLYDDPAERHLNDIDLLVQPVDAEACTKVLRACGYTNLHENQKIRWLTPRSHHLPPLYSPSGFCVEIHTSVVQRKFDAMLPGREVLRRAMATSWRGQPIWLPHPSDRAVHNIVHSQLHDLSSRRTVELRQLRELAFLVARHSSTIDWKDVEYRFEAAGRGEILRDQLAYCQTLMAAASPIARPPPEKSLNRLKLAVMDGVLSRSGARKWMRDYLFWLRENPSLALNLINPFWWPRRIRLLSSLLKRDSDRR